MVKKIFVFGSNREGRHGAGAALHAQRYYGAQYGNPRGRQGDSYAIVTKELRRSKPKVSLAEVASQVDEFIRYARRRRRSCRFLVSAIGCRLAGFSPEQIAPLFAAAPGNVFLPPEFVAVLRKKGKVRQ